MMKNYMNNKLLESTTSFLLSRVRDQRGNISLLDELVKILPLSILSTYTCHCPVLLSAESLLSSLTPHPIYSSLSSTFPDDVLDRRRLGKLNYRSIPCLN